MTPVEREWISGGQEGDLLKLVAEIAKEAASILDLDQLLAETAERIQERFGYFDVLIFLIDRKRGELIRKAWAGSYRRGDSKKSRRPIGERGIVDWVARHGESVLANDVRRDPRYFPLFPQTRSELCVPIKDGEKIIGGINVESDRPNAFSENDLLALEALENQLAIVIRNARLHQELKDAAIEMITMLARVIEERDAYTAEHCEQVAELAIAVGRRFGLSPKRLEQLRYAALLHDVGKVGFTDGILTKPGKLTEAEWAEVHKHPTWGRELIASISYLKRAAEIVEQHHERFDGQGYPKGLQGEEILLEARILAVADAYSAMRSDRPYRKALSEEEARQELRENAGTQFDPQVVEVFLQLKRGSLPLK